MVILGKNKKGGTKAALVTYGLKRELQKKVSRFFKNFLTELSFTRVYMNAAKRLKNLDRVIF